MTGFEKIFFHNNLGRRLAGRIYSTGQRSDVAVIFSHGLFSSKDGYKITRLADAIVATGLPLMTFDFSFAGESEGNISDLSTLQEVEDLASAIRWAGNQGWQKVHLIGSSMGASVTLLYGSRNEPGVESLVLIATPVDLRRLALDGMGLTAAEIDMLPEEGFQNIDGIEISNSFFRELALIDIPEAARKIGLPVLSFHGGRDSVVDPSNIVLLGKNLAGPLKKVIIDDGDHNLTRDKDIALMKDAITDWLGGGYMLLGRSPGENRP
ncbi:MAG: alpha/beta fold hydrolase [Chrysiogenales bacterium]|nr:MAG: alpha/beta fold hydrolase [Chrysiogenales bacterium]